MYLNEPRNANAWAIFICRRKFNQIMLWIKSLVVQGADSHLSHAHSWMIKQDEDGNKICTGDSKKLLGGMKKSEGVFLHYTTSLSLF